MRLISAAAALCLGLALALPGRVLCASQGGMAADLVNSMTTAPGKAGSRPAAQSQGGPAAPVPPRPPVVPGAPPADASQRPLGAPQPRHLNPAQAPAARKAQQPRLQVLGLSVDGVERRALVTLPKPPPARKGKPAPKAPLIIFLHGAGGSAGQAMRQTGLAERAAAAGYIAAFPEGLGPEGGQTWNAWMCCGYARDQRVDDVGFLSALMGRLKADYGADPRRVYLAGFSNGAMLASRFVLERPGVAAALASVAGYLPCDAERPAEQLPVLIIHGSQDAIARYAPTPAHPATGRHCEDFPARAQVDFWIRGFGLPARGQVHDAKRAPARVEQYGPAKKGGGLVRFVVIKGGGHAWPGGARERYRYCDLPVANVDATALVLDFFRNAQQMAPAPEPAKETPREPAKPARKRRAAP